MIRRILFWALIITFLLTILVSIPFYKVIAPNKVDIEQGKFFLEIYKTIGVAFLIAFLGVVIPHVLAESRESFLRFKESRIAYSEAKTSIIYLPLKLSNIKSFNHAVATVEEAHRKLHLCETYPAELRKHLHWHPNKKTWVDRNYWELIAIRKVLDVYMGMWAEKSAEKRLEILLGVVNVVGKSFAIEGSLDNDIWWRLLKKERWWYLNRRKNSQKRQYDINEKITNFIRLSLERSSNTPSLAEMILNYKITL